MVRPYPHPKTAMLLHPEAADRHGTDGRFFRIGLIGAHVERAAGNPAHAGRASATDAIGSGACQRFQNHLFGADSIETATAWLITAVTVSPTLSEPSMAMRDGSVTSTL